ncbi:MAG TPA: STAS domain-containing protein [Anaeromyxobacteraceae bacterium]|nr:STAS domain-containing protein [Anaeromyxobacteraceae bacterium]
MAGIRLNRWIEGGRRVLRLLGTFDGAAARELLTQIQLEAEREIVIDVALVSGFDEVGVAALARLAESSDERRIALRGLSTHQLRILRYLGAGLSQVGAGTRT